MAIIDSTTGHSRAEERKVANALYVSIGIAVIIGVVLFLMMGQKKNLSTPAPTPPTEQASPNGTPPAPPQ